MLFQRHNPGKIFSYKCLRTFLTENVSLLIKDFFVCEKALQCTETADKM